jgi:lysophospholipase L1-like esterase
MSALPPPVLPRASRSTMVSHVTGTLAFSALFAPLACSSPDGGGGNTPGTGGQVSATGGISAGGRTATSGGVTTSSGGSQLGGAAGSLTTGGDATLLGGSTSGGSAGVGGATITTGGNSTNGGAISAGGTSAGGNPASGGGTPIAGSGASLGGAAGAMNTGGSSGTTAGSNNGGQAGSAATGGSAGAPANVGPNPDAATRMRCTGTSPITCHFGGQPGNYDVTVVLGGGTSAGTTLVEGATLRALLGETMTASGQTQRFTFTVNVRQPEGQPIQDVPAGTAGLDLYFKGAAPQLLSIGYAAATSPVMVYIAGDSTVCDQSDAAYSGWGQKIPQFFNYPVSVANYSDSGESSVSFLASSSLWGAINSRLKANDWVFIQFGHNDKTTTPDTYRSNILSMITAAKNKNARPVLVTPISRATFSGSTLTSQHVYTDTCGSGCNTDVPAILRKLATDQNVPLIDLTARTTTWLNQLGPNGWQSYFALASDGTRDKTHTGPTGAAFIAGFVRDAVRTLNLPLAINLR